MTSPLDTVPIDTSAIAMFSTFCVPLGQSAHQLAESRSKRHTDWQTAEQVYLNTLAIYAVRFYLESLGFETDWESSDSQRVVAQTLMDVADLIIKHHGELSRLECRRVLPDATCVSIPAEVWGDRIGYVAVLLDEALSMAELVGFINRTDLLAIIEQTDTAEIPFAQLQSIAELPTYLKQVIQVEAAAEELTRQTPSVTATLKKTEFVQLSQWLQDQFDAVWQAVEDVFTPQQVQVAWRQKPSVSQTKAGAYRVKVLDFGLPPGSEAIALLIGISPTQTNRMDIEVQVMPTGTHDYLPHEVQVRLLSEAGIEIIQTKAIITETIQLHLEGQPGERFSVEVTVGTQHRIETFVI